MTGCRSCAAMKDHAFLFSEAVFRKTEAFSLWSGIPRRITRKNHSEPAFQRRRSSARLREQLREYFEVRFRIEKYGVPYFWPKAKRSKGPAERGCRSKSAERGRGFKWRAPTRSVGGGPFKPQTALLPEGRPRARSGSGLGQTR
jgi:hypothetical protein